MLKTTILLSICLACALSSVAHASKTSEANLDIESRPFSQQAAQIRADLAASDKYSEISPADRDTVLRLLARIEDLLASVDKVDALPMQSKVDLFNDQEQVNTILTGARADSRMICRREIATGSHRKQQTCMTVAERERRRERDIDDGMQMQKRTPCLGMGRDCATPGL
jgi:hypothetical protein